MSLILQGWSLGQKPPEATDSVGLEDFPEARPTGPVPEGGGGGCGLGRGSRRVRGGWGGCSPGEMMLEIEACPGVGE